MKKIFLFLMIILPILSSCASAPGISKMKTQLYTSQAGYSITLPASWQLITEDEQSAIFSAPDDDITLTVVSELGGEAYYTLQEIAQMLLDQLPGSVAPWQISRTLTDTEKKLRLSVKGEDEAGVEVVLDISLQRELSLGFGHDRIM
jgi:hypothetical protein